MQNEIPEDKLKETEELSYEFAEKLRDLIIEMNDKRTEGTSMRMILTYGIGLNLGRYLFLSKDARILPDIHKVAFDVETDFKNHEADKKKEETPAEEKPSGLILPGGGSVEKPAGILIPGVNC